MSKVQEALWFHKAFCIIPPIYFIMEAPLDQQEKERLHYLIESRTYKCFRNVYSLPVHAKEQKPMPKREKKIVWK